MASSDSPEEPIGRLRRFNLIAGVLHAIQAAIVITLTNGRSIPVTAAFSNGPPGLPAGPLELETLFSYRIGWAVAAFLVLSAGFHFLVGGPFFSQYRGELLRKQNRFRWAEYSMSSSIMIVVIAGTVGITDVVALIALGAVNASMIFFGWLMETTNEPGPGAKWSPFRFGSFAGSVPWIAIVVYVVGAGSDVPGFVYGIVVSLFLFFNCFAVTQVLQYRGTGKWADYLRGERTYIVLSLVAKSALAWQVFANVLIPEA